MEHFTTLENTPVEYLMDTHPKQTSAADAFPLGLAVLHVLTGAQPYEEILADVRCPAALASALSAAWMGAPAGQYDALKTVLEDDEDDVLLDTLYRYLVLFGVPARSAVTPSPAWEAVWSVFPPASSSLAQEAKTSKAVRAARKQFDVDVAEFSWATGTNELLLSLIHI